MVLSRGSFQVGSGPIFLSELKCDGTERDLLSCPNAYHTPPGLGHECDHTQDVAIQCQGKICDDERERGDCHQTAETLQILMSVKLRKEGVSTFAQIQLAGSIAVVKRAIPWMWMDIRVMVGSHWY